MKRYWLTIFVLIGIVSSAFAQLPMQGWRLHTAYNNVTRIEDAGDKIYALSEGSLFSVDKEEQTIAYYNRLTGLTSTDIADIKYDSKRNILIIAYKNGYIDFMENTEIINIPDLYNAQLSISKEVNQITIHQNYAYMAMDFGIIALSINRREIADTYYIGENAAAVEVLCTAVANDSLYAATKNGIYTAALRDNLVDYSFWEYQAFSANGKIQQIISYKDSLCVLCDSLLYVHRNNTWTTPLPQHKFYKLYISNNQLFGLSKEGTYTIHNDYSTELSPYYTGAPDMLYDNLSRTYWYAYMNDGITSWHPQSATFNNFLPSGPLVNTAYRMRFAGNRLFIVNGGYLGVPYGREPYLMWMENNQWTGLTPMQLRDTLGFNILWDWCDIIAHPTDPTHFYVASYGNGLIEFQNDAFYKWYYSETSPLTTLIANRGKEFTRVDALTYDAQGNLWMLHCDDNSLVSFSPEGTWTRFTNPNNSKFKVPKHLLIDHFNPNIKIGISTYNNAGIGLWDDNGTISYKGDDRSIFVPIFEDEDGNKLTPKYLHSAALDKNGVLWIGTEEGVLKFTRPAELFHSNKCSRVKIARTDGSGLADYLLGNEQINAIAVDGANRIWFGTEGSGVYLMDVSDPQDIVTVHHYTSDNSPLPSNTVISIAINPITGEVFFGTGSGLVSYQSDAADGKEDYTTAYAYPNPVRSNFEGVITIAGLMEDTQVRITDNGGNLVYETKSNGGIAIWDGRNGRGERVRTGVYFAMCVTADGANKTLVKIFVMN